MENRVLVDLVNRFKYGDDTSFDEIYACFSGLIRHYSIKRGGEDMMQSLSLFLVELLHSINLSRFALDETDGLKRYISVAIRNHYIHLSKEECEEDMQQAYYFSKKIPSISDYTDEKVDLNQALKRLNAGQRRIMVYKYLYEYRDTEIATILKVSRQAVNRLQRRAIESLKRYYKFKK